MPWNSRRIALVTGRDGTARVAALPGEIADRPRLAAVARMAWGTSSPATLAQRTEPLVGCDWVALGLQYPGVRVYLLVEMSPLTYPDVVTVQAPSPLRMPATASTAITFFFIIMPTCSPIDARRPGSFLVSFSPGSYPRILPRESGHLQHVLGGGREPARLGQLSPSGNKRTGIVVRGEIKRGV